MKNVFGKEQKFNIKIGEPVTPFTPTVNTVQLSPLEKRLDSQPSERQSIPKKVDTEIMLELLKQKDGDQAVRDMRKIHEVILSF